MPDLPGRTGRLPAEVIQQALAAVKMVGTQEEVFYNLVPYDLRTAEPLLRCGRAYYTYPANATIVSHITPRGKLAPFHCDTPTPPPDRRTVWCPCGRFRYGS